MYLYSRISWIEKITKNQVLRRINKEKELLLSIKETKLRDVGRIMAAEPYEILQFIFEGKIQGKRSIGRRQNASPRGIGRWFGRTLLEIFRAVMSQAIIGIWIINLLGLLPSILSFFSETMSYFLLSCQLTVFSIFQLVYLTNK